MEKPLDREIVTIGRWGIVGATWGYRVGIRETRKHVSFGYGSTLSEAAVSAIKAVNDPEG
jgi:hypothetical protein